MSEARVLFVAHDAGGTIPPVLAVAAGLVAAGHEVTVLAQPSVAVRAEAIGCTFETFEGVPDYAGDRPIEEQLDVALPLLVGEGPGRQAIAVADAVGADVVVVDPNLGGVLAAVEADDRPSAVLLHSLYRTFVDVWFGELWPLLGPAVDATRERFGLSPCGSWAALFDGHDLVLSPVPAAFDAPAAGGAAGGAAVRHVGFLVPPPASPTSVAFPPVEGARVLVSLSTTYQAQQRQLATIVEGLADVPVSAVATTSGAVASEALRPPPNVRVERFVPHSALLPHADLVVTHGGLGTVAAALSHGVPLVCQPVGRDQCLNAERVRALGAGAVVDVDASAVAIAAAVQHVLGADGHRAAAEALARASREAGGTDAAVAAVLGLVGG